MVNARAVAKKTSAGQNGNSATKHLRLFFYPLNLYVGYPKVTQMQNPEKFIPLEEMFLNNMLDFQSYLRVSQELLIVKILLCLPLYGSFANYFSRGIRLQLDVQRTDT